MNPQLLLALSCLVLATVIVTTLWAVTRRRRRAPSRSTGFRDDGGQTVAPPMMDFAPPPMRPMPTRPGVKTIAIVHDFGNPAAPPTIRESLTVREAFEVLAQIREAGEDTPIDMVLHTPGGSAFACELIAGALKDRPNTTAYVPYCAMSAGTIIALSCEKVVMGKNACLGPIDNQFMGIPADAFQRLMKDKPIQNVEDFTVLVSYIVEKEQKNAKAQACALMNKSHFAVDDACQITDFLASGDLPHSEQINRARAMALGVNVVGEDCPSEVYDVVEMQLDLLGLMPPQGMYPEFKAGAEPVKPTKPGT